jgi:hypothetical protein
MYFPVPGSNVSWSAANTGPARSNPNNVSKSLVGITCIGSPIQVHVDGRCRCTTAIDTSTESHHTSPIGHRHEYRNVIKAYDERKNPTHSRSCHSGGSAV